MMTENEKNGELTLGEYESETVSYSMRSTTPDTGGTTDDGGYTPPENTTPDTGGTTDDGGYTPPENTTPDTGGTTDDGGYTPPENTTPDTGGTSSSHPIVILEEPRADRVEYLTENHAVTIRASGTNCNRIIAYVNGEEVYAVNGNLLSYSYPVSNVGTYIITVKGVNSAGDMSQPVGCTITVKAISLEGYFKISSGNEKYLTYRNQGNDPITVESANDLTTQIWKIERSSEDNKYHIRPAKYSTLAMNVYRSGAYPCTIQPTANNIADTSFNITYVEGSRYQISWQNYNNGNTNHYLVEGNGTVGEIGKVYWRSDLQYLWTFEETNYTPTITPSECPRIRYGSTSGSNYENVVYDKGYGFNLENLKFKQKDDWAGTPLTYAGASMKFVLNEGYSCVLYSYAMVLYALGATVTKYDYRTNKIEEIAADPYSCLMANIGAEGDWSEAQFGEITIREQYFYDKPTYSPVNVVYGNVLSAFGNYRHARINLSTAGTLNAAKSNAEVITTALDLHPEGVIVRCSEKSHSFVVVGSTYNALTAYDDISSIGACFTVYDSAGVNGGTSEGGINFNESWSCMGRYSSNDIRPDDFSSLSYYEVIERY